MSLFRKEGGSLFVAAFLIGCGAQIDPNEGIEERRSALTATANQSLLITNTSVTRNSGRTEDPCSTTPGDENKVWTMGRMLKQEAQRAGTTSSAYVNAWMDNWGSTVSLQEQTIPPLIGPGVRSSWLEFAGGDTTLPLHKAPFWLLAIVNRIDLRKHRPPNETLLGGELRFVFGILNADTNNPPCPSTHAFAESTLILEYSVGKTDENQVLDYARRWLELSNLDISSSTYRTALAALTEEVIIGGKLLRIRTNEGPDGSVGGAGGQWDMTEFEADATTKFLKRSTIKQSPTMALAPTTDNPVGGSQSMSDWIWSKRRDLFANAFDYELARAGNRAVTEPPIGSYLVPIFLPDSVFLGARNTLDNSVEYWGSPTPTGVPSGSLDWREARFRFSVGTCLGCHSGETGTSFLHIFVNSVGTEANRSPLLSGPVTVPDPAAPSFVRTFDEMRRRENDLRNLVNQVPVAVPVLGNNYKVRFHASGKCLDSVGNTITNGALSQLYDCHGDGNQRLAVVETTTAGVYNLKYRHSGKCIDVQNASTSTGARVEQRTCSSSRASQRLTLSVLPGTIPNPRVLRFQHSNLCLLVQNQGTANGTAIVQDTCPQPSDFAKGFHLVE